MRLTCGKDGKKMRNMGFENVWQNVMMVPIRCHSGFGSTLASMHDMNLLFVPQILTWTAILALQSANASSLRSNCSKKLSVEQLRCFLGEDASFWQDQSHHILSLLTLTKDILVNICEMLWEQLQDKLVCIAGVPSF